MDDMMIWMMAFYIFLLYFILFSSLRKLFPCASFFSLNSDVLKCRKQQHENPLLFSVYV